MKNPAQAAQEPLSFSGIAEVILGHESWSMRSQNHWQERRIIKFESGFPVEVLEMDSKSFSYSAPDKGYGFGGSSSQKDYEMDWSSVVKQYKPQLILWCCTRDNGEGQLEKYKFYSKRLKRSYTREILDRIYEFDKK